MLMSSNQLAYLISLGSKDDQNRKVALLLVEVVETLKRRRNTQPSLPVGRSEIEFVRQLASDLLRYYEVGRTDDLERLPVSSDPYKDRGYEFGQR